jgi:hypothetical protein
MISVLARLSWCIIISLISTFSSSTIADVKSLITPSPISIAVTVGQWLLEEEKKSFYVQVEATADSKENARNEAFRLAVEMAVGALVISELEVKNNEVARNDIIKYSSGYIDNFKIKSESKIGERVRIVVDVWVGESKIADRLLSVGKDSGVIDGERIAAQQNTIKTERHTASQLIEHVAKDFPKKAFDIKVGKIASLVDGKEILIDVPIKIKWNSKFLEALYETFERTKDPANSRSQRQKFFVFYKKQGDWNRTRAGFVDIAPEIVIKNYFLESEPQLRINFKDASNRLISFNCRSIQALSGNYYGEKKALMGSLSLNEYVGQFFSIDSNASRFDIFGDFEGEDKFRTAYLNDSDVVAKMRKVEAKIVPKQECIEDDPEFANRMDVRSWCNRNLGNGKSYCPAETR